MRQIQMSRRRRPTLVPAEPMPLDPRDPDIVRAKQLARSADPPQHPRRRPDAA